MNPHLNELTHETIGAAIEVHRELGPGLLESAYEACFCYELKLRGIVVECQVPLPLQYKDTIGLRLSHRCIGQRPSDCRIEERR